MSLKNASDFNTHSQHYVAALGREAFGQGLGLHESGIWNVGFIIHVVKPVIAGVSLSMK